jgi:hypothetical protein
MDMQGPVENVIKVDRRGTTALGISTDSLCEGLVLAEILSSCGAM